MNITNQSTIDEWSDFTDEDLKKFGDEGDGARKTLLDPVITDLLGTVSGEHVLDAGCGNGYFARKLATMGAQVTGVEPARNLIEYCRQRESADNLGVSYIAEDLTNLALTEVFDQAVLINVLMDIPDYQTAFKRVVQAVKPGGVLVFSILHPAFPGFEADWQRTGEVRITEYFNAPPVKQKYGHLFHHPLQDYSTMITNAGCVIQQIVEPQDIAKNSNSRSYHIPQFLVMKLVKNS